MVTAKGEIMILFNDDIDICGFVIDDKIGLIPNVIKPTEWQKVLSFQLLPVKSRMNNNRSDINGRIFEVNVDAWNNKIGPIEDFIKETNIEVMEAQEKALWFIGSHPDNFIDTLEKQIV